MAAKVFGRDIEKAGRGAAAASLSFHGLGRSVGFASAQFLGGAGIVFALKSTIDAAEESQRVLKQTENAVTRSGQSWAKYGDAVDKVTLKQSQMSGFDDERLKGTFSLLVRRTKDVTEALKLNAIAANVARGANIDLETAAKIVQRASVGQARGLAALGIQYTKTSTGAQLLAQINQKYAASAAAYANTAAGAQDRFRVALENFQEVLGAEALPAITKYLNQGADWLNQTKNQHRVLSDLRAVVGTVKDAISAATPFVEGAAKATEKLSDALGGTTKALKLLIAAGIAWKAVGLASKFNLVGNEALGASGKVGILRGALGRLPTFVGITVGLDIIANAHTTKHGLHRYSGSGGWKNLSDDLGWSSSLRSIGDSLGIGGGGSGAKSAPMQASSKLGPPAPARAPGSSFFFNDNPPGGGQGNFGTGSATVRLPTGMAALSRQQRNAITLAAARTPAQQLAALGEQRSILANQIGLVRKHLSTAHGNTAKKLADELANLTSQDTSAFQQIASINEQAASDAVAAASRIKGSEAKRAKAIKDALAKKLKAEADVRKDSLQDLLRLTKQRNEGLKGFTLANLRKGDAARMKAAAVAEQAAQYRALGFTGTGDALTPTRKALTSELGKVNGSLRGTLLDTDVNRNQLTRIRNVLNGNWKALTRDTKMRIKELLDALNPDGAKAGPLFKGHGINLAKATAGLPRAQALIVQQRLAAMNLSTMPGATLRNGDTIIHHTTVLDGKVIAESVTRTQKKKGRHTATQVRGPYAGKQGL